MVKRQGKKLTPKRNVFITKRFIVLFVIAIIALTIIGSYLMRFIDWFFTTLTFF
jgi:uncharacterized membrane protein